MSTPWPPVANRLCRFFWGLLLAATALAEAPRVVFDAKGLSAISRAGDELLGPDGLAVTEVVLETPAKGAQPARYRSISAPAQRVEVQAAERRVIHHHPWGRAELVAEPAEDHLRLRLRLHNSSREALADFRVRLLSLVTDGGKFRTGAMRLALDRPVWYELPLANGRCFATVESATPVLFGLSPVTGERPSHQSLLVQGGAPAWEGLRVPPLGVPRVLPGQTLELVFGLRFAPVDRPAATVLSPYFDHLRRAQGEPLNWPDRRPIGRLTIPGGPEHVTIGNPRGWFHDPDLATGTPAGQAELRRRVLALAHEAIARLRQVDAQGVVIWNLEGRHSYPDYPYGDPRRLADIAPEMDAIADALFEQFRDAGLRPGVCLRPALLHHNPQRQRWSHNSGAYDPEHEELPRVAETAAGVAGRVYPVAARLSAQIAYARKRWGCTIFYVHAPGIWWQAEPSRPQEWLPLTAETLAQVRRWHPDVLLVPAGAEQHLRPTRAEALRNSRADLAFTDSLRGLGDGRLGNLPTPPWVVADSYAFWQFRGRLRPERLLTGPRHPLYQAYWAHGAPYAELKRKRELREYVLTLEQHMEYSLAKASEMAAEQIAFETTPDRVRAWLPTAFSVLDLQDAEVAERRAEFARAAAWGDVLMWHAPSDPLEVAAIYGSAKARQQRLQGAARALGLLDRADDLPVLPISEVWRLGRPLDPQPLVLDRPVPGDLRLRAAVNQAGDAALLMVGWNGQPGHRVRLRPNLPGLPLAGENLAVWQLPRGARLDPTQPIPVAAEPVGGLSVLLVQAAAGASRVVPGVLLGVDFATDAKADIGGRLPYQSPATTVAKVSAGALVLGQGAASYGVVPDWARGSLEFDLEVQSITEPLPVITARHHLDFTLSLQRRDGQLGLFLESREEALPVTVQKYQPEPDKKKRKGKKGPRKDTANPLTELDDLAAPNAKPPRETFAKLGQGPRRRHVLLTWELGQYHVYADGRRLLAWTGPRRPLQRDGSVFAPGLIVGGESKSRARLDNLRVYDWAFSPREAAARKSGAEPLARPDRPPLTAWLWGRVPEMVQVGVDAAAQARANEVEAFHVKLYERLPGGRRLLGSARLGAVGGVAVGELHYAPVKGVEAGGGTALASEAPELGGLGNPGGGLGGDPLDELEKTFDVGKPYLLEITPLPAGQPVEGRTITFQADRQPDQARRW